MRFRKIIQATFFVSMFVILLSGFAAASLSDCADIPTAYGQMSGVLDAKSGTCSYKGIPYAAPPVGDLRWAPPQEPAPWKGTLAASKFGEVCMQVPFSLFGGANDKYEGSEDCLYLNIWQPAAAPETPRAVIVFIHGGSNLFGAGSLELYDGTRMAAGSGVILVTINYRLGPFGMLAHPVFSDSEGLTGNYLVRDQIAALRWVKNNIASFGGDPGNITVSGESAGGMSVADLLLVKEAKGLFQKAIIESGPPMFLGAPSGVATKVAEDAAATLGCPTGGGMAACMRKAGAKDVMNALRPAMAAHGGTVEVYDLNLVMDDRYVFTNPYKMFEDGDFNKDVPVLVGTNRDEAGFYALSENVASWEALDKIVRENTAYAASYLNLKVDPDAVLAKYPKENYSSPRKAYIDIFTDMIYACPAVVNVEKLAANGAKVFQYQFEMSPDENRLLGDIGVFHAAELPFVFGNFNYMDLRFSSKRNSKASRMVQELWTSFAKSGQPSAPGAPEWKPYTTADPAYMRIGEKPEMANGLKAGICAFYDPAYREAYPH